jgi:hypothetical protein
MTTSLGCTRYAILTKNYAFKFPRLDNRNYYWGWFCCILKSLIANIVEYNVWKHYKKECPFLCPIIFHLPFGLLNVMPRCTEILDTDFKLSIKIAHMALSAIPDVIEKNPHNFGFLNGQLVCFDYE